MASKDEKDRYDGLTGGTDVPVSDERFSLEEILAEYGAGREQRLMEAVEQEARREASPAAPPPEPPARKPAAQKPPVQSPPPKPARQTAAARQAQPAPSPEKQAAPKAGPAQPTPEELLEELRRDLPPSPHPITLEDVVGSTVDAVMEEDAQEPLLRPRRGLFSRRRLVETEELYAPPEPEPEEIPEIDTIGPEPELADAAADYRAEAKRRRRPLLAAALAALLPVVPLVIEAYGYEIQYWSDSVAVQSGVLLACLAVVSILARQVFAKAFRLLARRRCTSELLAVISAVVMAADCVARLLLPDRSAAACYAPVGCFALVFAMWGGARESRGMWDTFRMASTDDEPPYLVTETEKGACKQAGSVPGFYTTALREDTAAIWQTALMPVVLVASIVFAGLSSLGQGRGDDFLLNWSAILGAGTTFALPLCWGMPFSKLAAHFHKAGCAVAGWCGAERISRRRAMILTDGDLFPPGTIQLNGVKVFGEDLSKVYSYAASMTRAADCGLQRLFDGLLRGEGGHYQKVDDFSFYEEGGYSATIRGESVLLGTASFMRKMEVRLPAGINLRTGIFLAMDRQLAAVFAVKYQPSENVDFALRMMRRSRITPILASRDPNITPALLKRKFHKGVKVEFPSLTDRVAYSEAELDRGMPRALLFREGLLPYAEAVVGSRRLCKAVRRATALSVLGSAAGTLLAFYLVFQGAYNLLTPLALLVFLLLWTLPVLILSDWAGRY
ncbi:MAG TPA: hypothetical protein H9787_09510 [Candidatus Oscillibacter excrementigallinarum]|uniref:Uncharacterized protein n=1 Tax=Candidatus Oscillibacter excrementigallinarum TaxID=2838716 RepID=A0A9D2LJL6_9FIRM|nr:hypothetical protein [Candidatus Oscillibacter excrementigallinarum]